MEHIYHQHLLVFLCWCQSTFELSADGSAEGAGTSTVVTMGRFVRILSVTSLLSGHKSLDAMLAHML